MLLKNIKYLSKSKKYLIFSLLFAPIFLNYFFNVFLKQEKNFSFTNTDFINLFIALIVFGFLVAVGIGIRDVFNLNSISIGLTLYLFSFFMVDNYLVFATKSFKFLYIFYSVNLVWITVAILSKRINTTSLILFSITFIFFRELIIDYLVNNYDLVPKTFTVPDEDKVWLPLTTRIYEINYFNSLTNNPGHSGYGLLVSHINAVLTALFVKSKFYYFYPFIKNIFYFLTMLFIFEIKSSKSSKIILSVVLLVVTLNSHWFRYIFFNSLMMESAVSYFFGVLLYGCINAKNKNQSYITALLMGTLFFSKQFIAIISLFYLLYIFITKKISLKVLLLGFSGFLSNLIIFPLNNIDVTWSLYFNNNSALDAERSIKLSNFRNLINEFLIDRPISYFLFIFFLLFMVNFRKNFFQFKDPLIIVLINTILVFFLYMFLWTSEVVYGSSYRYFMNTFHVLLPIYLISIDRFINIEKEKF